MKEVLIEIKGTQQYSEEESDVTTFTTRGTIEFSKGVYTLVYDESEMIGADNVHTEMMIEGESKMVLARSGGMNSRLVVEKGRRHSCLYNTPQGDFIIGIYGDALRCNLSKMGGSIYMSYTLDVNSGLLSKNIMEIKIKEISQ